MITAYTAGSGLDRRLERVGQVGSSVVVGWGAELASALAALHEAGLVHSSLGASRVLLGRRDRALLDASCARAGGARGRAGDLAGLVAVLRSASGGAPGALAPVLDAVDRGELDAAALADRLASLTARGSGLGSPSRGVGRALAACCLALVLLVGAAVVGVRLATDPQRPAVLAAPAATAGVVTTPVVVPSTSASPAVTPQATVSPDEPAPEEPDWAGLLGALDESRGLAFAAADLDLLAAVDVDGSEAHRRDRALIRLLRRGGVSAAGWETTILDVVPRSVRPDRAVLVVTDTLAAYELRDADGHVVATHPARPEAIWTVRLAATPAGWRISSVDTASPAP